MPPGPTATSGSEVKDSSQDILENHSPPLTKGRSPRRWGKQTSLSRMMRFLAETGCRSSLFNPCNCLRTLRHGTGTRVSYRTVPGHSRQASSTIPIVGRLRTMFSATIPFHFWKKEKYRKTNLLVPGKKSIQEYES